MTSNFILAGSWWRYTNSGWIKSTFSCRRDSHVAILVHGLMQSHDNMTLLAKTLLNSDEGECSDSSVQQEDATYDEVWCYDYEASALTIDIAKNIHFSLTEPVKIVKELSFFAHSLGGLIVRYMHEQLNFPQEKCHTVFFGTPHAGIPSKAIDLLADNMRSALPTLMGLPNFMLGLINAMDNPTLVSTLITFFPGIGDLTAGSSFLKTLNENSSKGTDQRDYYTIVGTSPDKMCFDLSVLQSGATIEIGQTMSKIYGEEACDGLIPKSSAESNVLEKISLPWKDSEDHKATVCVNHQALIEEDDAFGALSQWIIHWRSECYVKKDNLMAYKKETGLK